ncbi:unnamed protein product [Amoebophrya sp. A120]|nr:unnamed protein product [Amoebophrya sp. A120]|eukprot:GSA120T00006762001.1
MSTTAPGSTSSPTEAVPQWTQVERERLSEAVNEYASVENIKDRFQAIAQFVGHNRGAKQCAMYFKEHRVELEDLWRDILARREVERKKQEKEKKLAEETRREIQAQQEKNRQRAVAKEKLEQERKAKEEEKLEKQKQEILEKRKQEQAKREQELEQKRKEKEKQQALQKQKEELREKQLEQAKLDRKEKIRKAKEDRLKKQEQEVLANIGSSPATGGDTPSGMMPSGGSSATSSTMQMMKNKRGILEEERDAVVRAGLGLGTIGGMFESAMTSAFFAGKNKKTASSDTNQNYLQGGGTGAASSSSSTAVNKKQNDRTEDEAYREMIRGMIRVDQQTASAATSSSSRGGGGNTTTTQHNYHDDTETTEGILKSSGLVEEEGFHVYMKKQADQLDQGKNAGVSGGGKKKKKPPLNKATPAKNMKDYAGQHNGAKHDPAGAEGEQEGMSSGPVADADAQLAAHLQEEELRMANEERRKQQKKKAVGISTMQRTTTGTRASSFEDVVPSSGRPSYNRGDINNSDSDGDQYDSAREEQTQSSSAAPSPMQQGFPLSSQRGNSGAAAQQQQAEVFAPPLRRTSSASSSASSTSQGRGLERRPDGVGKNGTSKTNAMRKNENAMMQNINKSTAPLPTPKEPANLLPSYRRYSSTSSKSNDSPVCHLCCGEHENLTSFFAFFSCNHFPQVCAICFLKHKFILRKNECPLCFKEVKDMDNPVVLSNPKYDLLLDKDKQDWNYTSFKIYPADGGDNKPFSLHAKLRWEDSLECFVHLVQGSDYEPNVGFFKKLVNFNLCPIANCKWQNTTSGENTGNEENAGGKNGKRKGKEKQGASSTYANAAAATGSSPGNYNSSQDADNNIICEDVDKLEQQRKRLTLSKHMRNQHDNFGQETVCHLCLTHQNEFPMLLPKYDPRKPIAGGSSLSELEKHMEEQHVLCKFCDFSRVGYFYSTTEAQKHLRDCHEKCIQCDKEGVTTNVWFQNYDFLYYHYEANHFVCTEVKCWHMKTCLFGTEYDYLSHRYLVHKEGKKPVPPEETKTGSGGGGGTTAAGSSSSSMMLRGNNQDPAAFPTLGQSLYAGSGAGGVYNSPRGNVNSAQYNTGRGGAGASSSSSRGPPQNNYNAGSTSTATAASSSSTQNRPKPSRSVPLQQQGWHTVGPGGQVNPGHVGAGASSSGASSSSMQNPDAQNQAQKQKKKQTKKALQNLAFKRA